MNEISESICFFKFSIDTFADISLKYPHIEQEEKLYQEQPVVLKITTAVGSE